MRLLYRLLQRLLMRRRMLMRRRLLMRRWCNRAQQGAGRMLWRSSVLKPVEPCSTLSTLVVRARPCSTMLNPAQPCSSVLNPAHQKDTTAADEAIKHGMKETKVVCHAALTYCVLIYAHQLYVSSLHETCRKPKCLATSFTIRNREGLGAQQGWLYVVPGDR